MWERGKNPGVRPSLGLPALGEGCLLCVESLELPSARYQLPNTTLDECPGFIFHLLPTSLISISFPLFFFFLPFLGFFFSLNFFSLTENFITESQCFTMTEAEPGICVKGLRKHKEG